MSFSCRDFDVSPGGRTKRVPAHRVRETPQAKGPSPAAGDQPDFANSPLPAAMLAVAHDDSPQNRRILYESMLKTWFLVPTREATHDTPGFHDVPSEPPPLSLWNTIPPASWWQWRLPMKKRFATGTRVFPGSHCRERHSSRQWQAPRRGDRHQSIRARRSGLKDDPSRRTSDPLGI